MNARGLLLAPAGLGLGACSSQELYGAGQAWQRNECFKLADQQERSRCLGSSAKSFEQYQRESKEAAGTQ